MRRARRAMRSLPELRRADSGARRHSGYGTPLGALPLLQVRHTRAIMGAQMASCQSCAQSFRKPTQLQNRQRTPEQCPSSSSTGYKFRGYDRAVKEGFAIRVRVRGDIAAQRN